MHLDTYPSDSDGSEVEDDEAAVLASAVHLDESAFQTLCGTGAGEDEVINRIKIQEACVISTL
jgi:hypothetical protein